MILLIFSCTQLNNPNPQLQNKNIEGRKKEGKKKKKISVPEVLGIIRGKM